MNTLLLRRLFALAALGLILLLVACGGDDDDDSEPTPVGDVCEQKDALVTAVEDLGSLDVVASGTDALHKSVSEVQTETAAMKQVASDEVVDEVDGVEAAVDDAAETVDSLDGDASVNEKIDELQVVFTEVVAATAALSDALSQECD